MRDLSPRVATRGNRFQYRHVGYATRRLPIHGHGQNQRVILAQPAKSSWFDCLANPTRIVSVWRKSVNLGSASTVRFKKSVFSVARQVAHKIAAMPNLPIAAPEAINIDSTRLQRAYAQLQRWVETDRIPAAGICVGRNGRIVQPRFFGKQRPEANSPP